MKKLISTIILAAFAAVCSFGAAAADTSNKNTNTTGSSNSDKAKWEKKYGEGGTGDKSTSQITKEKMPKDLSPEEKYEYRDQEVMDKKPYKQPK